MTDSWDRRAAGLQSRVRKDEAETDMNYDDSHVRRSVVLAREDIVMMVSYLSTANSSLANIRVILMVVVCLLGYIAYRLS
jgi:hypothetical protein